MANIPQDNFMELVEDFINTRPINDREYYYRYVIKLFLDYSFEDICTILNREINKK